MGTRDFRRWNHKDRSCREDCETFYSRKESNRGQGQKGTKPEALFAADSAKGLDQSSALLLRPPEGGTLNSTPKLLPAVPLSRFWCRIRSTIWTLISVAWLAIRAFRHFY